MDGRAKGWMETAPFWSQQDDPRGLCRAVPGDSPRRSSALSHCPLRTSSQLCPVSQSTENFTIVTWPRSSSALSHSPLRTHDRDMAKVD